MHVLKQLEIPFPVAAVWALAGDFHGLPAISSGCASSRSEEDGAVRVLTNTDGSVLWERRLTCDPKVRILSCEIIAEKGFTGAYGEGYVGIVKVVQASEQTSFFVYEASFEPRAGFSLNQAEAAVAAFASDCALNMGKRLSGQM